MRAGLVFCYRSESRAGAPLVNWLGTSVVPLDASEFAVQRLVDADIEIRDGIPVFRMPPDAPILTSADVDRLLHSDLHS